MNEKFGQPGPPIPQESRSEKNESIHNIRENDWKSHLTRPTPPEYNNIQRPFLGTASVSLGNNIIAELTDEYGNKDARQLVMKALHNGEFIDLGCGSRRSHGPTIKKAESLGAEIYVGVDLESGESKEKYDEKEGKMIFTGNAEIQGMPYVREDTSNQLTSFFVGSDLLTYVSRIDCPRQDGKGRIFLMSNLEIDRASRDDMRSDEALFRQAQPYVEALWKELRRTTNVGDTVLVYAQAPYPIPDEKIYDRDEALLKRMKEYGFERTVNEDTLTIWVRVE